MAKKRVQLWDMLLWLGLAWILIWLTLKAAGILHTPAIIEWSPAFCAVYVVGRAIQKLYTMERTLRQIGNDVREIGRDFRKVETEHNMFTANKIHG
jgi:hypothetical protein